MHRTFHWPLLAAIAIVLFCALCIRNSQASVVLHPRPLAVTPPMCDPAWHEVASPDPGVNGSAFFGVTALSASDVWVAGYYTDQSYAGYNLVEHWNGSAWSVTPSPPVPGRSTTLVDIDAFASNDVWAVGYYRDNTTAIQQTLTQHWNGSTWSRVESPSPGTAGNFLNGVVMIAANDVWAVGYYDTGTAFPSLIEHWNGSAWSVVPSPSPGSAGTILNAVDGTSTHDVWAVGYNGRSGLGSIILHWNGSTWTSVQSPDPPQGDAFLFDIAAISPTNAWVAGKGNDQTLTKHWDGTSWSIIPSPNVPAYTNGLLGISAVSSSDVWAVGSYTATGPDHALTEYWNGSTWTIANNDDPPSGFLYSVAAVASDNVWAVGYQAGHGGAVARLVEHFSTDCVSTSTPTIVPTATQTRTSTSTRTNTATPTSTNTRLPTQTPGGPTATPEPSDTATSTPSPTDTPTVTSTACPLQFPDVPEGNAFYPFVRCLACRGIVNGYSDGTFRPNNNITRGQLSKIISNSAGFNEPHSLQDFQDVPVGSTFYIWIERLYSRSIINGYLCGAPGEPCVPPGYLPYFRPNNNATRGQITKIDAYAAGYNDPPVGQQFQDVPPGSTFYTYTYQLVTRGIMSGYPCGGAGEPCVPPDSLPYFRPNNNATRGQTSKIVANTFFPNCQTPEGVKR